MATSRDNREVSTYVAWQSHLGVELQIARLRDAATTEPALGGQHLVDTLGLVIALWRLRLSAQLSQRLKGSSTRVDLALQEFEKATAGLRSLRNVAMHFDEYVLETDKRRTKVGEPPHVVATGDLWAFKLDVRHVEWLDVRLDFEKVEQAARRLYDAVQADNNSQLD